MSKITFDEWLGMHPYEEIDDVDRYYTNLANKIKTILRKAKMDTYAEYELDVETVGLFLATWFEDIVSGIGIWRVFTDETLKRCGSCLPTGPLPDTYQPGKVNAEDVRFLLRYYFYTCGTTADGEAPAENPRLEDAAVEIHQLLQAEYPAAPVNRRMQALLNPGFGEDDFDDYKQLVEWFSHYCYLTPQSTESVPYDVYRDLESLLRKGTYASWVEVMQKISRAHEYQLFTATDPLLSLTAPQWLSRLWSRHPRRDFWAGIGQCPASYYRYERKDGKYLNLTDLCRNNEGVALCQQTAPGSDQWKAGETIFRASLLKYGSSYRCDSELTLVDGSSAEVQELIRRTEEQLSQSAADPESRPTT